MFRAAKQSDKRPGDSLEDLCKRLLGDLRLHEATLQLDMGASERTNWRKALLQPVGAPVAR